MHILFVHPNFPAQFGHIAHSLVRKHDMQATFATQAEGTGEGDIERIIYRQVGGARETNHYCTRTFENFVSASHGVYEALKARPDIKPDLIVGHSGFGTTMFLADLYPSVPIINYAEYYYRGRNSDMDFLEAPLELDVLRARSRNAGILCDLQACTAAYSPTEFQRGLFPKEYAPKIRTLFDGVDTTIWKPRTAERTEEITIGGRNISPSTRIVTYVSRGFEAMRGFHIFMQAAKKIYENLDDVVFVCVGTDRTVYGSTRQLSEGETYRQYILKQDNYDLNRFVFTGRIPPESLARLLTVSDLHIYLTVPFVLSWSMMNAMACGCTVLASSTAPVAEMITHNQNGLLNDFFDADGFAQQAIQVLQDPAAYRHLGIAAHEMIQNQYCLSVMLPRLLEFYESVANGSFVPQSTFTPDFCDRSPQSPSGSA